MISKPSKSDLFHWRNDKVTKWVMDQLLEQFQAWPVDLPPKDLLEMCTKAGQQQVLKRIDKLCDTD